MGLVVERFLYCDIKGCENNTIDSAREFPSNKALRLDAEKSGWRIINKNDICSECYNRLITIQRVSTKYLNWESSK